MSTRRSLFRKLYLPIAFFTLSLCFFALAAFATNENSANENGDLPFTGDRRPGILEPPSDIPTGENAHLYDFLKDSLSGEPLDDDSITTSASSAAESLPSLSQD